MISIISMFTAINIGFIFNLYLFKKFTTKKIKCNIKKIAILFLLSATLTFFNLMGQPMLNTFGNLIFTDILIFIFFKSDLVEATYYSLIIWILTVISDILLSFVIVNSGLDYYAIAKSYVLRSVILLPILLIEFVTVSIHKVRMIINNIYKKYYKKMNGNPYFSIAICLIVYVFLILIYINLYKSDSKIVYYSVIAIMFLFLLVLALLIKYIIKSYELAIINKSVCKENELVKEISKKDQIFRHNLINNLMSLESVANKKLKKMIINLIETYKSDYNIITHVNDLPNGIRGLIYQKAYLKDIPNLNLIVENYVEEDLFEIMDTKNYSLLCESVGILFDNALEAVENASKKIIFIEITSKNDFVEFKIKNTFENILDLDKLGLYRYTTKLSGSGIGLNYLMNNKKINFKSEITNDLFNITIKLKKQNKTIL